MAETIQADTPQCPPDKTFYVKVAFFATRAWGWTLLKHLPFYRSKLLKPCTSAYVAKRLAKSPNIFNITTRPAPYPLIFSRGSKQGTIQICKDSLSFHIRIPERMQRFSKLMPFSSTEESIRVLANGFYFLSFTEASAHSPISWIGQGARELLTTLFRRQPLQFVYIPPCPLRMDIYIRFKNSTS